MKTKLFGAATLAVVMGISASHRVAANSFPISYVTSIPELSGTPLPLTSIIKAEPGSGWLGADITINGSSQYTVSGAYYNSFFNFYYASLFGNIGGGLNNPILPPSYSNVTITVNSGITASVSIGGYVGEYYNDIYPPTGETLLYRSAESWGTFVPVFDPMEPKLTVAQKAGIAAELVLLSAIAVDGAAACPLCSPVIFETVEGLYGALLPFLADPADPNYMVLSVPPAPPILTPPDVPEFTEQQTEAWADLVNNLALWSTLPGVMLDSIQRAEGAYQAGDAPWVSLQLANFDSYYQQDLTYAAAVEADAETLGLTSGVPEPSTWAMMFLGFGGLCYAGYRASRKSAALA